MSKLPEKIRLAFEEVRKHRPQVCMVMFTAAGRWVFMDEDHDIPAFKGLVDVSILEDAVDCAAEDKGLPCAYDYEPKVGTAPWDLARWLRSRADGEDLDTPLFLEAAEQLDALSRIHAVEENYDGTLAAWGDEYWDASKLGAGKHNLYAAPVSAPRTPAEWSAAGCTCVRYGVGNPHWPCPFHPVATEVVPEWLRSKEAFSERLYAAGWRDHADAQWSGVESLRTELLATSQEQSK